MSLFVFSITIDCCAFVKIHGTPHFWIVFNVAIVSSTARDALRAIFDKYPLTRNGLADNKPCTAVDLDSEWLEWYLTKSRCVPTASATSLRERQIFGRHCYIYIRRIQRNDRRSLQTRCDRYRWDVRVNDRTGIWNDRVVFAVLRVILEFPCIVSLLFKWSLRWNS